MTCFNDLPMEIQAAIWALVVPHRGGVHWIEVEGIPHPAKTIQESLGLIRDLFGGIKPDCHGVVAARCENKEFNDFIVKKRRSGDDSSPFFQYPYPTVPSVWGRPGRPDGVQDLPDEVTETRRCRQLSTYTQIATLLSVCRSSRAATLRFLSDMDYNGAWTLYRSAGPTFRTRPLHIWKEQYESIETAFKETTKGKVVDGLNEPSLLVPKICGTLDLVVLRLHTASGYPTPTLKYADYQLQPEGGYDRWVLPSFNRIGIEWHALWATPEGRRELCEKALSGVIRLTGVRSMLLTKLYWLVDAIPRPQWDQYPSAISLAFSRIIEKRRDTILKDWEMDETWKSRLLEHHDLYQEFEANGRRYYVVFVVAEWQSRTVIEESFLDPTLDWDGPFPGGEELWPNALLDPVRLAYEVRQKMSTDQFCTFVMSWEPV